MSARLGLDSPTERKADLHKIHVQSRKQMFGPIFQGVRSLKQLMMRKCSCDYLSLLFMFYIYKNGPTKRISREKIR